MRRTALVIAIVDVLKIMGVIVCVIAFVMLHVFSMAPFWIFHYFDFLGKYGDYLSQYLHEAALSIIVVGIGLLILSFVLTKIHMSKNNIETGKNK